MNAGVPRSAGLLLVSLLFTACGVVGGNLVSPSPVVLYAVTFLAGLGVHGMAAEPRILSAAAAAAAAATDHPCRSAPLSAAQTTLQVWARLTPSRYLMFRVAIVTR
eukprot:SAG11_NODE_1081_length_5956_cov_14.482506_5_plen_106_part_00